MCTTYASQGREIIEHEAQALERRQRSQMTAGDFRDNGGSLHVVEGGLRHVLQQTLVGGPFPAVTHGN